MGTQLQPLRTPGPWGRKAVQADSAWNLDAHHVVSQAGLQLSQRIPEASSTKGPITCVAWQPKTDPDQQRPLCPQLSPLGRLHPYCGFFAWSLLGRNPNPNRTPKWDLHRNLSLPQTLTLLLSRLLAWALTSALEGGHETGVASALATSLDQTLTLAKAPSHCEPNFNV